MRISRSGIFGAVSVLAGLLPMVAGASPPAAHAGSSVPIHGVPLFLAVAQAAEKTHVEALTPTAFGNERGTFVVYASVSPAPAAEVVAASRYDAPGLPKRPRLDRRSQPFVAFLARYRNGGPVCVRQAAPWSARC